MVVLTYTSEMISNYSQHYLTLGRMIVIGSIAQSIHI